MTKRATIKDVAARAGVSKSTVSLVLRNSTLIKPDTAEKVRVAIKELGYVYNRAAASLRDSGSGMVALVVNDLRNPFFTEFAIATQTALMRLGCVTVIANTDEDPTVQTQVIHSMLERDVSAFVICPAQGSSPEIFQMLHDRGVPALQVLRKVLPEDQPEILPHFTFNYHMGGRLAAEHLIDQGCRKLAFLGGYPQSEVTTQRLSGFLEVTRDHGLDPVILHGRPTRQFGRSMVDRLLDDHPELDGYYCFNDRVALGAVQHLTRRGIEVGKRIKVIGFDDIDEASHSEPALSTIRCDIAGFGARASVYVSDWLTTGKAPGDIGLWACEMVARESTRS